MTREEAIREANNEVLNLFYRLLDLTPKMIERNRISYRIGISDVCITWYGKDESDNDAPIIPIVTTDPFKDIPQKSVFSDFYWDVRMGSNKSPVQGYTFYISTSAGMYRIPELSRWDLAEVQDKIEKLYLDFGVQYIKELANLANEE